MARVGIGMRLEDVATAAQVSKNALSAIERGASSPNVRTLQRIVQVLQEHGAVFRAEGDRVWVGVQEDAELAKKLRSARKAFNRDRDLAQTIGKVARAARKARRLTLEDAAERLGLTAEFYARIERGYSLPSTASLAQMVTALDVSADVLIGKRPLTAHALGRPRIHEAIRGGDSRALKEAIGRGVHQARMALKLTQEDAAERIGVSPEFYSRIERGAMMPSLRTLARMVWALDASADVLLGTEP
jgi:transcriptional regulator with XRE-family HTH domain